MKQRIKGSHPVDFAARVRQVLDILTKKGIKLKAVPGNQAWMWGRFPAFVRTAKLTSIPTKYGKKTYSYEVWHLNFDRIPDTIKKLVFGLFDEKGGKVLAIISTDVDKKKRHSAVGRYKLSAYAGKILFSEPGMVNKKI